MLNSHNDEYSESKVSTISIEDFTSDLEYQFFCDALDKISKEVDICKQEEILEEAISKLSSPQLKEIERLTRLDQESILASVNYLLIAISNGPSS
jgi:hypothetical protein